jgi:2-C-methyl-D-erythritol 4-phosphate cytidylyltransferase/2-C-methyl-D-erythritol 2,4-cyclodiphosphate synthase
MPIPPAFALIVAGGRGTRAGGDVPKQYRMLGGMTVLRWTVLAFQRHADVAGVQVVIHPDDEGFYADAVEGLELPPPVTAAKRARSRWLADWQRWTKPARRSC